ncbi:MAG: DUF2124 domain-containing protein [Methanomicrobiales archaeon]|nr:DUF2124 domain-containing protein [Methanomicrobiales archaeon]
MAKTEIYKSVPGILRPYKEYISSLGLSSGDQIVYYGCAGTCTPFVELLAIAIRALPVEQVFVPLLDETKAKRLVEIPDAGMQVAGGPAQVKPKVIVIMGGLAMPGMPLSKDDVRSMIKCHDGAKVAGVCFMSMFEKAGWLDTISFDILIDATIDPVTVTKP